MSAAENVVIPPKGNGLVDIGININLPVNTYGRIAPRSGLALHLQIDIGGGVIDQNYQGSIKVILFNHGNLPFRVKIGLEPTVVEELEAGFYGSQARSLTRPNHLSEFIVILRIGTHRGEEPTYILYVDAVNKTIIK